MGDMDHNATGGPNVVVFPPLIPVAGLGVSLVARLLRRTPIVPGWLAGPRKEVGVVLIAAGVGLAGWAAMTFQRSDTSVSVHDESTALVEEGPYRYTRNPIYVGGTAAYTGITLLLNNLWGILLLPVMTAALQRGVIEREEAYLRGKFGEAYEAYTARVPRWLL
jgi:protein-S-isoprenylcysteine O-methyltransferase Ste14